MIFCDTFRSNTSAVTSLILLCPSYVYLEDTAGTKVLKLSQMFKLYVQSSQSTFIHCLLSLVKKLLNILV